MQLNRLLAGSPDKTANLRVIRALAKTPLPQAHFAGAGRRDRRRRRWRARAAREAQKLRPDWELAVLLEAQVLQKRSPAAAAKRLGEFVAKYPDAREARPELRARARARQAPPEARKQFEAVAAASPQNPDVIYAVGLLAFQLKDYRRPRIT